MMASPLTQKRPQTLCICKQLLSKGESIVVDSSLISDWELAQEKAGRITIRPTGVPSKSQITYA